MALNLGLCIGLLFSMMVLQYEYSEQTVSFLLNGLKLCIVFSVVGLSSRRLLGPYLRLVPPVTRMIVEAWHID